MNTAVVKHVEVLEARRLVALCVWCKRDAEDAAQWISLNGRPVVPLCPRCHKDVERVAQAMVVFGRFVLPKMVKK
jgi:hypothetical protein